MEIIIGILLGSLCGILLGLIPGFNIGIAFLGAASIPNPRLAIGLIIGIEITANAIKHLSFLNCEKEEDLDNKIRNYNNKEELCLSSIFSYTFVKVILSIVFAVILFLTSKDILNLAEEGKLLSLCIGIPTWIAVISKAKHWKLAIIASVGFCLLAIFSVELPIRQPMFIIVSCLYSANLINQLRESKKKIKLNNVRNPEALQIDGIASGFLSGFLWGLPTTVGCSLLERKESAVNTVSRKAVAEATVSVIGLTLLMALNSAKSAAASSAQSLNIEFHNSEISAALIVSAIITAIIYQCWTSIMEFYVAIHNNTPNVINKITIVITIAFLVIMSNGWVFVIALSALMLNKIAKFAEAPKELSQLTLGVLPLMSIVKSYI